MRRLKRQTLEFEESFLASRSSETGPRTAPSSRDARRTSSTPTPRWRLCLIERYRRNSIERVAVPAGLHHWAKLARLEQSLADIVESTSGVYIAQSEIDMIRIARGEWDQIDPETLRTIRSYIRPGLSDEDFRLWCKRYATCFTDATSWMEAMRNFDFVVGPRFHGVMLAMQAGTPGGVIAHDSRTLEMCETMQIPVRKFDEFPEPLDLSAISSLFTFDVAAYDRARSTLGRNYLEMLTAAGIEPSQGLRDLSRDADAPRATPEQAPPAMAAVA